MHIRDHYFECKDNGECIYLGSANFATTSPAQQTAMYFENGITNPIMVVRGSVLHYEPPKEVEQHEHSL